VCDRLTPWAHGTAVFAPRLPGYWDYNAVRVQDAADGLDACVLAEVADELQQGLGHRKLEVEVEAAGERLSGGFEQLGWVVQRMSWMRHAGPVPRAGRAAVEEVEPAAIRPLQREWLASEPWFGSEWAAERFLELQDQVAARRPARCLAVRAGGEPAAFARLLIDDATAEVEDVYCGPRWRGRGFASALVAAAVAEARAAAVADLWIVADADDWPRGLYARLGFEHAWLLHEFIRPAR
jgi:GNAT superfamily N-acetyltransferase